MGSHLNSNHHKLLARQSYYHTGNAVNHGVQNMHLQKALEQTAIPGEGED